MDEKKPDLRRYFLPPCNIQLTGPPATASENDGIGIRAAIHVASPDGCHGPPRLSCESPQVSWRSAILAQCKVGWDPSEPREPNAAFGRNQCRLGLRPDPVGTESQPTKMRAPCAHLTTEDSKPRQKIGYFGL